MKATIQPNWISQEELRKWCNISDATEYRWKKKYGLHVATMGDKVFYDRNQITEIITSNSTYALKTA